jgi:hypothetical protein
LDKKRTLLLLNCEKEVEVIPHDQTNILHAFHLHHHFDGRQCNLLGCRMTTLLYCCYCSLHHHKDLKHNLLSWDYLKNDSEVVDSSRRGNFDGTGGIIKEKG